MTKPFFWKQLIILRIYLLIAILSTFKELIIITKWKRYVTGFLIRNCYNNFLVFLLEERIMYKAMMLINKLPNYKIYVMLLWSTFYDIYYLCNVSITYITILKSNCIINETMCHRMPTRESEKEKLCKSGTKLCYKLCY